MHQSSLEGCDLTPLATKVPTARATVHTPKMSLLSAATAALLTAKRAAHVIRFMGTRNQLFTVARWLSGMSSPLKRGACLSGKCHCIPH